jgi:hypothetical protein
VIVVARAKVGSQKTEPETIQRERERMCFEKMRKNREREGSARGVPVREKQ